jgi:hypothetical protein
MDPQAALTMARDAYVRGDYERAADAYAALDAWLTAGGFQPDWQVQ